MSAAVIALRPLRALDPAEKARLPMSVARAQDGTEIIVSHYEDDVWELWPHIRVENRDAHRNRIDFGVRLRRIAPRRPARLAWTGCGR